MKELVDAFPSYEDLVESFEVETLANAYVGDYQGDYYDLLRDGDRYGVLVFGYGSCSGCDALEGCYGNLKEVTALRDDLWASITWASREETLAKLKGEDAKLQWYGHEKAYKEFMATAVKLLEAEGA